MDSSIEMAQIVYSKDFIESLNKNNQVKEVATPIAKCYIEKDHIGTLYEKPSGERFIRLHATIDNKPRFIQFSEIKKNNPS